jgi:hypothetical protein
MSLPWAGWVSMLTALMIAGLISTEIAQAWPVCIATDASVDAPRATAIGRVWHRTGISQLATNPTSRRPIVPKPQSARISHCCGTANAGDRDLESLTGPTHSPLLLSGIGKKPGTARGRGCLLRTVDDNRRHQQEAA